MSTFDIASDAFASFKEILTKHKPMVADFLELNYDEVKSPPPPLLSVKAIPPETISPFFFNPFLIVLFFVF